MPFVDADYDPDNWSPAVLGVSSASVACMLALVRYRRARGMEFDPERGARCTMCFDMRMDRAALYAHEWGFDVGGGVGLSASRRPSREHDILICLSTPVEEA